MTLLSLLAIATVAVNTVDGSCPPAPSCETGKTIRAGSVSGCGIDDYATLVGLAHSGGDEISLSPMADAGSPLPPDAQFCVAGSETSRGGRLLRVDMLVRSARERRVVRWYRVSRTGFYWESTGSIEAGEGLEPGKFQFRYGAVDVYPRVTAIEWPEQMRASRRIGAGAVITADDLELTPLVEVGDAIELRVSSGPILLALKATSLSDVAAGGVTRLALEHNGAHTYGFLLDQKTAVPCRLPLRDRIDDCER